MASSPAKRECAQLVVIVVRAQHLADPHKFSKQDPFCLVELSNSTQAQTKVDAGGGQTPIWDDEFRFTVYEVEGEQQKLKITVMRQESKQESEMVGEAYVVIDGKWKDNEFDEWVEVKLNGKYMGEVFLEMTYYPAVLPATSLQRRPSKLDPATRVARGPMILPLPADNPSGRFVPAPRPKIQQALAQSEGNGYASRPAPNGNGRPPVPGKGVKAQAFVAAGANPPAPTRKPPVLPLPGDPEPPEIPAFLRPGRQGVPQPAMEATAEESENGGAAPQAHPQQPTPSPEPSHHHSAQAGAPPHQQPHFQLHGTPQPFAEQARPPPHPTSGHVQHQSDPQLPIQHLHLDPDQAGPPPQRHSMPQPATSPAPPPPHQQGNPGPQQQQQHHGNHSQHAPRQEQQPQWQPQQQQQGERRSSGPPSQPGQVAHAGQAPVGWMTGVQGAPSAFTQAPQGYQADNWARSTQPQPSPTPQIQVQTTGAIFPANIPHHPTSPVHAAPPPHQHQQPAYRPSPSPAPPQPQAWTPAQPATPPSTQPYGQGPYPAHAPSHQTSYQPTSTPSPQFQPHRGPPPQHRRSQSPPVVPQQQAPYSPPVIPQGPYRPSTAQPQQQRPPVEARRSSSLDFTDSVPLPGAYKGATAPPLPPKTPLAPPLPPPPAARSPSPQPPPTPPRRLRADTPPRVASPAVPAGRTKLEEFEREQQAERERRRVEERERAQAQGREDGEEDRFDDAELPPPIYSVKPTAAEKGKGPATTPSTGDSKRTAAASTSTSASATASSSSSAANASSAASSASASRIHAGQAALAQRIQQEREDARMAAALARENERRESERQEREKKADEEFARMMREEERLQSEREAREREDEELAKRMAEEGVGEEEARRRREEQDEELARSLAEAA